MSSFFDQEPYPPGKYYIVDISAPTQQYLALPQTIRLQGADEICSFSGPDMLDIELSAILPCLHIKQITIECLHQHVESILDDGKDNLEAEMIRKGVDVVPDVQENTEEQLRHTEAILELGVAIGKILDSAGLYRQGNENGDFLSGEYVSIDEYGMLMLRAGCNE